MDKAIIKFYEQGIIDIPLCPCDMVMVSNQCDTLSKVYDDYYIDGLDYYFILVDEMGVSTSNSTPE